jgi:hypothetical protein
MITNLMLAAAVAMAAPIDRVVDWHVSTVGGVVHDMPPADCLVGPLPVYTVDFLPLAEMNRVWPTGNPDRPNRIGMTLFAHSAANPGRVAIIYLADELPAATMKEMLAHEQAHLRGCQHPGYQVHADGTPVR